MRSLILTLPSRRNLPTARPSALQQLEMLALGTAMLDHTSYQQVSYTRSSQVLCDVTNFFARAAKANEWLIR